MADNDSYEIITCRYCDAKLRIPKTRQLLRISCPKCQSVFYHNLPKRASINKKKLIGAGAVLFLIIAFLLLNLNRRANEPSLGRAGAADEGPSNWITISYGGLVDREIYTHNGESVGMIISQITGNENDIKGLVQPYLEPFSILCHDALIAINGPDSLPLVNILNHYPIDSEQPGWVALFREGHYQLYYNSQLIRVFIKGADVGSGLEQHRSVINHAIRDVLNSNNVSIKRIEVYVFNNNYATAEITLNTIPQSFRPNEFNISSRKRSIDLASMEDFLKEGMVLEAVEVDGKNDLYFYGKQGPQQYLAGYAVSLSDLAVIYRSIFHYGNNAPYISLDRHEDNRYAKVNFGGHLENTHAGHVVLEADKLFKALSTGIDPNTHELIRTKITKNVPDFLTEDERSLIGKSGSGHTQIRYWFYPDSIGTVTDGSIGAILNYQFLADVERMDMPVGVSGAVRNTINHLNRNFAQYEDAFATFRELSTVGRIMALINWLKGMSMDNRIELDEFLSVKLPAFSTPKKTKKMLAITAIEYPEYSQLSMPVVKDCSKVFYISDLLDKYDARTTDSLFLTIAGDYFDSKYAKELSPPRFNQLKSQANKYDRIITGIETKLQALESQIKVSERTLDSYDVGSINRHNELVDDYNALLAQQKSNIDNYNALVNQLKSMNIVSERIASIGGGINLRPSQFKRIYKSKASPQIREISSLKKQIHSVGKIARLGAWVRNNVGTGGARINALPIVDWNIIKSADGSIMYSGKTKGSGNLSMKMSAEANGWQTDVRMSGSHDYVEYSTETKSLKVTHSDTGITGTGIVDSRTKRIVFVK